MPPALKVPILAQRALGRVRMSPTGSPSIYDVVDLANVSCCPPCLLDPNANIEGAPARNQSAIAASKIMHPNDDVGMKGQIGLPQR